MPSNSTKDDMDRPLLKRKHNSPYDNDTRKKLKLEQLAMAANTCVGAATETIPAAEVATKFFKRKSKADHDDHNGKEAKSVVRPTSNCANTTTTTIVRNDEGETDCTKFLKRKCETLEEESVKKAKLLGAPAYGAALIATKTDVVAIAAGVQRASNVAAPTRRKHAAPSPYPKLGSRHLDRPIVADMDTSIDEEIAYVKSLTRYRNPNEPLIGNRLWELALCKERNGDLISTTFKLAEKLAAVEEREEQALADLNLAEMRAAAEVEESKTGEKLARMRAFGYRIKTKSLLAKEKKSEKESNRYRRRILKMEKEKISVNVAAKAEAKRLRKELGSPREPVLQIARKHKRTEGEWTMMLWKEKYALQLENVVLRNELEQASETASADAAKELTVVKSLEKKIAELEKQKEQLEKEKMESKTDAARILKEKKEDAAARKSPAKTWDRDSTKEVNEYEANHQDGTMCEDTKGDIRNKSAKSHDEDAFDSSYSGSVSQESNDGLPGSTFGHDCGVARATPMIDDDDDQEIEFLDDDEDALRNSIFHDSALGKSTYSDEGQEEDRGTPFLGAAERQRDGISTAQKETEKKAKRTSKFRSVANASPGFGFGKSTTVNAENGPSGIACSGRATMASNRPAGNLLQAQQSSAQGVAVTTNPDATEAQVAAENAFSAIRNGSMPALFGNAVPPPGGYPVWGNGVTNMTNSTPPSLPTSSQSSSNGADGGGTNAVTPSVSTNTATGSAGPSQTVGAPTHTPTSIQSHTSGASNHWGNVPSPNTKVMASSGSVSIGQLGLEDNPDFKLLLGSYEYMDTSPQFREAVRIAINRQTRGQDGWFDSGYDGEYGSGRGDEYRKGECPNTNTSGVVTGALTDSAGPNQAVHAPTNIMTSLQSDRNAMGRPEYHASRTSMRSRGVRGSNVQKEPGKRPSWRPRHHGMEDDSGIEIFVDPPEFIDTSPSGYEDTGAMTDEQTDVQMGGEDIGQTGGCESGFRGGYRIGRGGRGGPGKGRGRGCDSGWIPGRGSRQIRSTRTGANGSGGNPRLSQFDRAVPTGPRSMNSGDSLRMNGTGGIKKDGRYDYSTKGGRAGNNVGRGNGRGGGRGGYVGGYGASSGSRGQFTGGRGGYTDGRGGYSDDSADRTHEQDRSFANLGNRGQGGRSGNGREGESTGSTDIYAIERQAQAAKREEVNGGKLSGKGKRDSGSNMVRIEDTAWEKGIRELAGQLRPGRQ